MTPGVSSLEGFSSLMRGVGPFETHPTIAVAVSGGGDSLALCLLLDRWVRDRSGRLIALTVDHRLRPDSAAEAARVGAWLAARGIEHHVLAWEGDKPTSRIQEAARAARYDLLCAWCRDHGVLHLATAHQREDQAETFLMRRRRNGGGDGLAAMSAIVETDGVRIFRPALGIPKEDLRGVLRAAGQEWLEDPSNRNRRFERVRVRGHLSDLARDGRTPDRIAAEAAVFGQRRIQAEQATARVLAEACRIHVEGYAEIEIAAFENAEPGILRRALGRLTRTIGGRGYSPAASKTDALLAAVRGGLPGGSATLGGCRFLENGSGLIVCREGRGLPESLAVPLTGSLLWDGRFRMVFGERREGRPGRDDGLCLGAMGREGWSEAVSQMPELRACGIPHPARLVLPAVRDSAGIREIPHLGYIREDVEPEGAAVRSVFFAPRNGLSGTGFCLAYGVSSTISSGVMEPAVSAIG